MDINVLKNINISREMKVFVRLMRPVVSYRIMMRRNLYMSSRDDIIETLHQKAIECATKRMAAARFIYRTLLAQVEYYGVDSSMDILQKGCEKVLDKAKAKYKTWH
jgi:hypothetical protein